jgi:hypothetical protein
MNPRVRELLDKDFRPTTPFYEPPMEDDEPPKQSQMPAFIVIALLAVNGFASVAPMFAAVSKMDGQWQTMWQTLLVGAIGYFINTTLKSAQKDSTISTLSKGQK